jgi:hypothetical protein
MFHQLYSSKNVCKTLGDHILPDVDWIDIFQAYIQECHLLPS